MVAAVVVVVVAVVVGFAVVVAVTVGFAVVVVDAVGVAVVVGFAVVRSYASASTCQPVSEDDMSKKHDDVLSAEAIMRGAKFMRCALKENATDVEAFAHGVEGTGLPKRVAELEAQLSRLQKVDSHDHPNPAAYATAMRKAIAAISKAKP